MGLAPSTINKILSLWKDGYFEGFNSVIELGSQHLSTSGADVAFAINNLGQHSDIKDTDIKIAKDVYSAIGFSNYKH